MGRYITNRAPKRFVGGDIPLEVWNKLILPAMKVTGQTLSEFIRDALLEHAKKTYANAKDRKEIV